MLHSIKTSYIGPLSSSNSSLLWKTHTCNLNKNQHAAPTYLNIRVAWDILWSHRTVCFAAQGLVPVGALLSLTVIICTLLFCYSYYVFYCDIIDACTLYHLNTFQMSEKFIMLIFSLCPL